MSTSFWRSGKDYDIEAESRQLQQWGEPFLIHTLQVSDTLEHRRPLVADFGCWSGRHLRLLERVAESGHLEANAHLRVIGIDEQFAAERLREAHRAYQGFQISDSGIAHTGLPASSVDASISWRVLHNLVLPGEWSKTLIELRRVMKHGAPLVVSVRAALNWMDQNAPTPHLYRTFSYGMDRDDLYFSERACYEMFRMYGFETPYRAERFVEEEIVEGVRVQNVYWMLCLVANKRQPAEPKGTTQLTETVYPQKHLEMIYS